MSRKTRKDDPVEAGLEGLPWYRRPGRGASLVLLTLLGIMVSAAAGLEHLKSRVESLPEYNPRPKLHLMEAPLWLDKEGWRPQILATIKLPEKPDWLGGELTKNVADQLAASGWVSKVKRVTQDIEGNIRIWCDYRQPIAMVETRQLEDGVREFVAIDKDGVRLPLVYKNAGSSGWLEIVGVQAAVPEPGQAFQGDDAVAAAKIAQIIDQQVIAKSVCAIDVTNFRGRKDKRQNHILLRLRGAGDFKWGSAVGEEFEEPNWQRKVKLIQAVLKRRSQHVLADVSCYENGVIMKTQPTIQTADGSQPRNR